MCAVCGNFFQKRIHRMQVVLHSECVCSVFFFYAVTRIVLGAYMSLINALIWKSKTSTPIG